MEPEFLCLLCFPAAAFVKNPMREGPEKQLGCLTAPLIRARSVVQVHPGPPFKSPINTRLFSLFQFFGISLERAICQKFAKFRIGRMALQAERLASIKLCRERCPVTSKDVEGSARHCKTVQGAGSQFWSACGGVVQLVRTPACQAGGCSI